MTPPVQYRSFGLRVMRKTMLTSCVLRTRHFF